LLVGRHPVIDFGIGALKIGMGDKRGSTVTRADDEDGIELMLPDQPVHLDVDHVQTRRSPPVPEQARFDMLWLQGLPQQRILLQVDLANGEVIGRIPVAQHPVELVRSERSLCMRWWVDLPARGHRAGEGGIKLEDVGSVRHWLYPSLV